MKKFAVGYANFFDNDLVIEIIEADNIKSAIAKHSGLTSDDDLIEWCATMPDTLKEIQQYFFDGDTLVGATEIK